MKKYSKEAHIKLAEIFGKINLSDLPAMSDHVNEILAITGKSRVTAEQLAEVILRDYSLTNKILQVVNSPYYNRGVPVSTIERAVTIIGIDMVKELAISISLFEEFIKSGVEKEGVSKLLTQSFLSANLSKAICVTKRLPVPIEEAYICTLFHNLGKVITLIYLPEVWNKIEEAKTRGVSAEVVAQLLLKRLTLAELGMEIARYWNFSDIIILAMDPDPPMPKNQRDTEAIIQNLAVFSNSMINGICENSNLDALMNKYKKIFSINLKQVLHITYNDINTFEYVSGTLKYGLAKLKLRSKLIELIKKL